MTAPAHSSTIGYIFILPILFAMMNTNAQEPENNLPAPVKKYLELVLPENPKLIKEVNLIHGGNFKTSSKSEWVKIKGEQHFKTDLPEFEWTGKTSMFKATDSFVDGKGREVDQAELLRWLGESVWFPTNFMPDEHLSWTSIDASTAKLNYRYRGLELFYIVRFDEGGYIVSLETERYMEEGKRVKWTGKVSDYRDFKGVKAPGHMEAFWGLEEGDFQYVDFHVESLEYKY